MKISGFTFIRNGIKIKYPFRESIQSILPICDEMIVAVGNSEDGTRQAVADLDSSKIKIIDTIWDDSLRTGGHILAQQTNIALDHISGDWGFYIQGDEVVHENDLPLISAAASKYLNDREIDGLLFSYYHFYGNYNYIARPLTRGTYPFEVRMIRNNKLIRSFMDAQGFRKFNSPEEMRNEGKPKRLSVKKTDAHIYHYGKVRGPEDEQQRAKNFHRMWHDDEWIKKNVGEQATFDYAPAYELERFKGSHPAVMLDRIAKTNWEYRYDPSRVNVKTRHKLLNALAKITGWRPFEFRNYTVRK